MKQQLKSKMLIITAYAFLCFLTLFVLAGCAQGEEVDEGTQYSVYYVSKDYTQVIMENYVTDTASDQTSQLVQELIDVLAEQPSKKVDEIAPLAGDMMPNNYSLSDGQINLDFSDTYKTLDVIPEILYRAAIVRTLTQIDGVKTVTFSVDGDALTDDDGTPIGTMTADTFIDNAGTEISSYEKAKLHLYFANEAGDGLIEVDREVAYNSNISMEKLVVEELIKGPNNDETYPTINPDTEVVSVTVKDGICYVNLDESFLTQPYDVSSDVTIYSIVDSLSELSNVNKVQFSINGATDVTYRDSVDLSNVFERNLDIVQ